MMKNKLIEKINALFSDIDFLEKDLNNSLDKTGNPDKVTKLTIGSKVMKMQELNLQLFTTVDIFLNIAEGSLDELNPDIKDYVELFNKLKEPLQDSDSPEIRKVKETIKSLKNE